MVLLHGANLSAEVWSYQMRDLAGSHRVLALDLRGHGLSSAGSEEVTISAMADDVAEVLTALELDHVVLAGHSMGGMVCQRVARLHPELCGTRIGAIALIATSGGLGLPVPSWGLLAAAVGRVAGAGVGIWRPDQPALPTGDVGYLASRLGFGRRPRPAEVAETLRMLRAMEPDVFTDLVGELLAFEEKEAFGDIEVPVAVAVGTSDHLTPPLFTRDAWQPGSSTPACTSTPVRATCSCTSGAERSQSCSSRSPPAPARLDRYGSRSTLTAPVRLESASVSTASSQRAKGKRWVTTAVRSKPARAKSK